MRKKWLEYLKDKRIIGIILLWLSGFFGACVVKKAISLILGITKEVNPMLFLVKLLISIALGYWGCKLLKIIKPKKSRK